MRACHWIVAAFTMELRRLCSYRADFWIRVGSAVVVHVLIGYAVWQAVFETAGTNEIAGYTLSKMLLYYVLAALVFHMIHPEIGACAKEIYEGTFSRYLVYPVSFFVFKAGSNFAQALLCGVNIILAALFIYIFLRQGLTAEVGVLSILGGILFAFFSSYLFFSISYCFEMLAFWLEDVWMIPVMLKFVVNLLGGGLLPLAIFPEYLQNVLAVMPFPYLVSFPVRIMMAEVELQELFLGAAVMAGWAVIFNLIARALWRRGVEVYSGVGM